MIRGRHSWGGRRLICLLFLFVLEGFAPNAAFSDVFQYQHCGETYARRITEKKAALLAVYEESILRVQEQQHMAAVKSCTEGLMDVFHWKSFTFTLPSLPDLSVISKEALKKVTEEVCREAMTRVEEGAIPWRTVWNNVRAEGGAGPDWSGIARGILRGNSVLSESVQRRLRALLNGE
ncbi:MAG: hypothetical protein K5657_06620 [Desulfovibrio sp.]|nr:hypothetical protein [Desulfovibrio sp.]